MNLKTIVVLIAAGLMAACTVEQKDFDRLMRQETITNAENTGHRWGGCHRDDFANTGFRGMKNGVPVSGVICYDSLVYTIRYF